MLIPSDIIQGSVFRSRKIGMNLRSLSAQAEREKLRKASRGQKSARLDTLLATNADPVAARAALERILGGNDLLSVNFLQLGILCARSVCRLHLRDSGGASVGFGTGFLVAPGVVMTNYHVISTAEEARGAVAEFDYEYDLNGADKPVVRFAVLADPAPVAVRELDFCLAAVCSRSLDGRRSLEDFGWLPLSDTRGKAFIGEYLTIIQHPGGERKQICVRENKLLDYDEGQHTIWYQTDTVAGSSGSPVFTQSWQIAALHHSGVPKTNRRGKWLTVDGKEWDESMDESRIAWIANEGFRISSIVRYLRQERAGETLAERVLACVGQIRGSVEKRQDRLPDAPLSPELRDGELRVTVPVRIAVRVGEELGPQRETPRDGEPKAESPTSRRFPLTPPPGVEVVAIDQFTYDKRPGYNPDFLGKGVLHVPMPKCKPGVVFKVGKKSPKATELKYWNYSVVMHRKRRLAIFSAANVDADKRPAKAGREGDKWFFDTRIPEGDQLGPEFYGQQTTFEVDRSLNPFDRGHLTRRLDAQWGSTSAAAKRNGDDSFHWTNCSPQHWRFNQGQKRWLGLEDYVIDRFAAPERRAIVFNGPVFDAPLSKNGPDGRPLPALDGDSHRDPIFGKVAIPKMFFKVVACARDGSLASAAFLMSQEDFLVDVDRLRGMEAEAKRRRRLEVLSDAEARLYQVRIGDIEKLTGLDFGKLGKADVLGLEVAAYPGPRPILELSDIHLR